MNKGPKDFSAIGAQRALSSDGLDWPRIKLFQWDGLSPDQAYDSSLKSNHIITIHGSEEPVKLHAFHPFDQQIGMTRTGDIQVLPAGEKMSCQWARTLSFLKIEIPPNILDQVAEESGFSWSGSLTLERKFLIQDNKLLQLGEWMLEEMRNGGRGGKLYRDSLTNLTMIHLLQHYTTSSEKCVKPGKRANKHISEVIAYMQQNLERDIPLVELAAVANMSQSHLIRSFKQDTGLTPHQYFIYLRIEHAKVLIKCGKLRMQDIAVQAGFADQGHFTKLFKRSTGFTPLQYAAR
ncbi:AraC family transcriptional regulator [Paenibacillus sp. YIM B09110]|uniref:AraC family transcriptional regulator n=1 Tax=Paenibacillus sp. YIM B09110 TaxID=3126102 RepID=UPI00301BA8F1